LWLPQFAGYPQNREREHFHRPLLLGEFPGWILLGKWTQLNDMIFYLDRAVSVFRKVSPP